MKRLIIVGSLFLCVSLSAFAQGFYFDVGIGFGSATTEFDGVDFSDSMDSTVDEIAVDLSMKLGYGPVAGTPIYIVGEIGGVGHRFYDDFNYVQFNSYLIGPGLIIYPVPMLQLGGSFGFSFVANDTDLPLVFLDSESGLAGNAYIALDLGKGKNGCLIGAKYFKATNTLEITKAEQEATMLSIFIKYAFRHKAK